METKIKKATLTRNRLLASARELFARKWYETVSVNSICTHAGLSNGIFYRYFKSKEDIFRQLLSSFLDGFKKDMEAISGASVSERLSQLLHVIITAGIAYKDLVTIFREGQYRFPEHEKSLRTLYVDAVRRVYGREITEAEYIYIISGVRFISTRSLYNNTPVDLPVVQKYIEGGFFDCVPNFEKPFFAPSPRELDSVEPEDSRGRIKQAAIKLFGELGYYQVHVFEIARAAGFSVGTFYMHFKSKEACLAEIVHDIGSDTRRFISINLDSTLNRLEIELQGMFLFLMYFEKNIHYYDIVREAEFVVNPAVTEYYNSFERGYVSGLRQLRSGSPRTAANMLMGISHYLGIEVFFSQRVQDRMELLKQLGVFMHQGIRE